MSSGIVYKTSDEIECIRRSSLLVGNALAEVARIMKPGMSTRQLDDIAEEYIRDNGAEPSFKGYHGYKNTLCISVNEEIVHGIPGDRQLKDGDVVSVDCGVFLGGFHGDSAYTFPLGEVGSEAMNLLRVTRTSLELGIRAARNGNRIGDISAAIQEFAEGHGFGVVRELVGHGIGRKLHEKPEVPNYGKRGAGALLKPGMTIAVEPMINLGQRQVKQMPDGWTVITADRKVSAHFEHTLAITEAQADVLSSFEAIEKAIAGNSEFKGVIEVLIN